MDGLIKLVLAVITHVATARRLGAVAPRLIAATVLAVMALMIALGAIGCAVAALWIFLLPQLGPAGAPLVAAGALLVLCGILLGGAYALLRRQAKPADLLTEVLHHAAATAENPLAYESRLVVLLLGALAAGVSAAAKATRAVVKATEKPQAKEHGRRKAE